MVFIETDCNEMFTELQYIFLYELIAQSVILIFTKRTKILYKTSHSLLFSFKATSNNRSHRSITLQWKKTLSSHVVHMWILPDKFNCFLDDVLSPQPLGLVWFGFQT